MRPLSGHKSVNKIHLIQTLFTSSLKHENISPINPGSRSWYIAWVRTSTDKRRDRRCFKVLATIIKYNKSNIKILFLKKKKKKTKMHYKLSLSKKMKVHRLIKHGHKNIKKMLGNLYWLFLNFWRSLHFSLSSSMCYHKIPHL